MSVYFIVEVSSYYNGVWIDTEERTAPMTRKEIAWAIGQKWKVDPDREDPSTFYEVFGKMELRYTVTHKVYYVEEPETPCQETYEEVGDYVWREKEKGVGPNGFYTEIPDRCMDNSDIPF